jgi:hypothetical protein
VDGDPDNRVPAVHRRVLSGEHVRLLSPDRRLARFAVLEDGDDGAVTLDVSLSYLNTGSIKSMMDMLDRLDEAHEDGRAVSVIWRCDPDNERIVELAEELLEDVSLPYEILTE